MPNEGVVNEPASGDPGWARVSAWAACSMTWAARTAMAACAVSYSHLTLPTT
jgi:hypothetical protein